MTRTSIETMKRWARALSAPRRPIRFIAEGRWGKNAIKPAPETFSFCVGRPWPVGPENPNGTSISVYAYGNQVRHGTMGNAEDFLKYVEERTGEKNFIYRLVPIA